MHYHLDGDTFVEQIIDSGEHFIPLQTTDIVEYLAAHPSLSEEVQNDFRDLASLIQALLHHLYRQRHEQLSTIYAPLDPDRDRLLRSVPTAAHRDKLCEQLLSRLRDALHRANFHRLTDSDIQTALRAASQWGVRMRVDFTRLHFLEVYARGKVIGERERRVWYKFFKSERIQVPLYQRVVVVFRVTEAAAESPFDPRRVNLRMFKNVPQQDVDMMLPGSGLQLSWLDHSRIVVPSLYTAGMSLWRTLRNVLALTLLGVFKTFGLVVLVSLAIGFGLKSMFTYRANTKQRYMLNMAQSLYFQNLDNNAGVLLRLLEEGEQQEAAEAILTYFVASQLLVKPHSLWQIDHACEQLIREATGMVVDFDIEATAHTLVKLGLMRASPNGWTAVPLKDAISRLDQTWDSWFRATP